jgi:hypothetical protein
MDYKTIYDNLIKHRQEHPAEGYTEQHHIVMRSMGGSNESSNLVSLTGREHWIAHLLLYKIHRNKLSAYACHMMAMKCEKRGIPHVRNSRMYEKIRILCSKHIGINNTHTQTGVKNSQYGTRWICNILLQQNQKISKDVELPDGWIVGRNKWIDHSVTLSCVTCKSTFKTLNVRSKYCSRTCYPPRKPMKVSYETRQKMSIIKKELYKDPTRNPNYGKFKNKKTQLQQVAVAE